MHVESLWHVAKREYPKHKCQLASDVLRAETACRSDSISDSSRRNKMPVINTQFSDANACKHERHVSDDDWVVPDAAKCRQDQDYVAPVLNWAHVSSAAAFSDQIDISF